MLFPLTRLAILFIIRVLALALITGFVIPAVEASTFKIVLKLLSGSTATVWFHESNKLIVARLEGFEPTTPGSEDRCSCPLSYRRTYS